MNFILDTDSYKLSHYLGYPKGAEYMYSYAESRGGRYDSTVFFGLQKYLKELKESRVTLQDVFEASEFSEEHGEPFNTEGWLKIVNDHDGKIPVEIRAVREGTIVPVHNVLATVENTDPELPWLTSYIETALLRATWYPTTVATRIHYMKKAMKPYFDRTSETGNMDFALLDFGARGASSKETAAIGGMAHLLHFRGSDNLPAILAARKFYYEHMAATSVPATEHSIMTSFRADQEEFSIEYLLDNMLQKDGILSIVGDTWNIYEFIEKLSKFEDRIVNKNGKVVIRPDSGTIEEVLPIVYQKVKTNFLMEENSKGYLTPKSVKVLQGDGMKEDTITLPFELAEEARISADAIMTGSGGGLLQSDIDRDTCKFAFKASNVTIHGVDYPINKQPITDPGKRSKRGILSLVQDSVSGEFRTVNSDDDSHTGTNDMLRTVYRDGTLFNVQNFDSIRDRAASNLS